MPKTFLPILLALLCVALMSCGGPSAAEIDATVQAAIQSTAAAIPTPDPCGAAALGTFADAMEEQLKTFEAQTAVVGATPRVSLGTPLQRLLDIQTETRRMDAPVCMQNYQTQVVSMMGLYRLAYETFAAQGDEITVQAALQTGQQFLQQAKDGLALIRAGKIPPTPEPSRLTPTP